MRDTKKLSGYHEMPVAISARFFMKITTIIAGLVVVTMTITVLMLLVVMPMATVLSAALFIRHASFDMDMGSVISRVAVPQAGAKPRSGPRVEQQ